MTKFRGFSGLIALIIAELDRSQFSSREREIKDIACACRRQSYLIEIDLKYKPPLSPFYWDSPHQGRDAGDSPHYPQRVAHRARLLLDSLHQGSDVIHNERPREPPVRPVQPNALDQPQLSLSRRQLRELAIHVLHCHFPTVSARERERERESE